MGVAKPGKSRRPAFPTLLALLVIIGLSACNLGLPQMARAERDAGSTPAADGAGPRLPSLFDRGTWMPLLFSLGLYTPATYYVSPAGNDKNPGSAARPWKTIQHAADRMAPGDTVVVGAGSYNERVQVTISGLAGAPIHYRANGVVWMQGFSVSASYITIQGFHITDTPDDWRDGVGIWVQGTHCLIEDNEIYFATRDGIVLFAEPFDSPKTSDCVVRNNRLHRDTMSGIEVRGQNNLIEGNEIWGTIQYHPKWRNPPAWADADGMRFFGSGHVIRGNYIHDISYNDPENISPHIDCFQTWGPAHDIVFERNVCRNMEIKTIYQNGQGFMIEQSSAPVQNIIVRNNILETFRGLEVFDCPSLIIVNNTFVGDLAYVEHWPVGIDIMRSPNLVVANNIFYNVGGGVAPYLSADDATLRTAQVGHNLVYMSDGRRPAGTPNPGDRWRVDPELASPSTGDYRLCPGSPAIDAGIPLATVKDDFDGRSRPQGAGYDIGAYEYAGSGATPGCAASTPAAAP